jgi:hypothetical protein
VGNSNDKSFADAIEQAQRTPNSTGFGANQDLPNLFTSFPIPPGEALIDNLPPSFKQNESNTFIKGIPRYRLKARIQRFIIGTIVIQVGRGKDAEYITEDHDDAEAYETLMNTMLEGKSILRFEERRVLNEGTVIIVVSYLEVLPKKTSTETT